MLFNLPMPPGPPIVEATVHAGTARIEYRRAGHGPPVLLVRSRDDGEAGDGAALLPRLATGFRVFAPCPQPAGSEGTLAGRLRAFLDGLGLERVAVVADQEAVAEVLWLAQAEPERIERIALLLAGIGDAPEPDRFEHAHQPVLLVRGCVPGPPGLASMERLLRFLAGDGAPPHPR